MKKRTCYLIIALTAGILFLACIPSVHAEGYMVQPAYGLEPGLVQDTSREVPFGELTPRAMIIFIALSFSPMLVYPVEFFLWVKLLAYLGYRKADEMALFYNRNRRLVYEAVAEKPGINFNALKRLTGIKEGTLKYHLLVLRMKRKIISFGSGRSVRYFENNGRYSELEKKVFLHLQDPTTRRILEILASSPEVSRKDIAEIVGVAGPSISWHTKRLSGDGIITTSKKGRAVRYTLCPAGANIFREYFGQDSGVAPIGTEAAEEAGKQSHEKTNKV
jgi:predicted transcriptional regulator